MGSEPVRFAVADADPLIHPKEIGCFRLLRIFEVLHVPDAVWLETVRQVRVSQDEMRALGNIQQHHLDQTDVAQFVLTNKLEGLQSGERERLSVCQHIRVSVLLTDDLAVREAAKRLGFIPVGSLGIVVKAYQAGHISLADERHRANLDDVSALFITRTIVGLAIEQLHQRVEQHE